ncbi:unnamed protein product [Schistosoma curassoni]|uniref:DNA helicase n=1 Tax=Schistosoma curassoni TaxID=6186 RepID=A0A183K203_9TREM|nr:unnamed protein product [Schistosoma curassoni]
MNPGFVLFGNCQQDVPVILRKLVLPDALDPMSLSFTVTDVNTKLFGQQLTSCRVVHRFPHDYRYTSNHHLISTLCTRYRVP